MRRFALLPLLLLLPLALPLAGCPNATAPTPPAAVAPGYSSQTDQQIGQALAALDAFVVQERANYTTLPAEKQAQEKSALNALIAATNTANAAYTAFHAGQGTLQQAQTALTSAQTAQANLVAAKGVR